MPRMRRVSVLLLALALAGAACSNGAPAPTATTAATGATAGTVTSPTSSPAPVTPTTSATASPTPAVEPDVLLPSGMADVVDDPADLAAISAGDLASLIPAGSSPGPHALLTTPNDPIDRIAVAWVGGEPPPRRSGLIVWQRAAGEPAWRATYAFTDPKSRGVFGVGMDQADATHDGIADLLTFEDVGGSGACGVYRVISSTEGDAGEIFRRSVCDTEIQIAGGNLRIREAVFEPDDPHCCPSAFRTTTLRWNGNDWNEVSEQVSAVPNAG